MTTNWSYYFCVGLIIIALLVSFKIIHSEYLKRKNETTVHTQKSLNIWSHTVMFIPILWLIIVLFQPIQSICKYVTSIRYALWHWNKYLITVYQIARLEYTFSVNQIHSTKYGYPNAWFVFLYLNGIGLIISQLFTSIYFSFFSNWEYIEQIQGCIIEYKYFGGESVPILQFSSFCTVWFFLWDWIVLFSYIIKIIQFYRKRAVDVPDSVLNRIKFILQKILFLTIILELSFWGSGASWAFASVLSFQMELIWGIIDMALTVFIVYLMIDHNNEEYIKLIKFLNSMRIFFCCHCFVLNVMEFDHNQDKAKEMAINTQNGAENAKEETLDTKTNNMPQTLHQKQLSVESQL